MINGLLGKRFGRNSAPTAGWTSTGLPPIVLDVDRGSVGPVARNATLPDARVLGRPDVAEHIGASTLSLRHPGIVTEFESGRLTDIGLLLVPEGASRSVLPRLALSSGQTFSAATTERDVRQALGEPAETDRDSDEIVLHFRRGPFDIEAEFRCSGTLRRINRIGDRPA